MSVQKAGDVGPDGSVVSPRRRRRRRWAVAGFAAFAVVVYVVVVLLYASSGRFANVGELPNVDPKAVTVQLVPNAVSATAERISMQVIIAPPISMLDNGGPMLAQDLSVIVHPVEGEQTIELSAGTIPTISTVSIIAPGEVEQWPLDKYNSQVVVLAFATVDGVKKELPTNVLINGGVQGWSLLATVDDDAGVTIETPDGPKSVPVVDITATRSGSTLAFGFLLLGLLVVMPTLVLIVAMLAYTGRRKVEATLMSWMGAMLFATIPLRTFLPGSPPIGAWIDFLIVLWVIVALVTGLAIYVAAWIRWGTAASPRSNPH